MKANKTLDNIIQQTQTKQKMNRNEILVFDLNNKVTAIQFIIFICFVYIKVFQSSLCYMGSGSKENNQTYTILNLPT